jgi:hypothetical protein
LCDRSLHRFQPCFSLRETGGFVVVVGGIVVVVGGIGGDAPVVVVVPGMLTGLAAGRIAIVVPGTVDASGVRAGGTNIGGLGCRVVVVFPEGETATVVAVVVLPDAELDEWFAVVIVGALSSVVTDDGRNAVTTTADPPVSKINPASLY